MTPSNRRRVTAGCPAVTRCRAHLGAAAGLSGGGGRAGGDWRSRITPSPASLQAWRGQRRGGPAGRRREHGFKISRCLVAARHGAERGLQAAPGDPPAPAGVECTFRGTPSSPSSSSLPGGGSLLWPLSGCCTPWGGVRAGCAPQWGHPGGECMGGCAWEHRGGDIPGSVHPGGVSLGVRLRGHPRALWWEHPGTSQWGHLRTPRCVGVGTCRWGHPGAPRSH